MVYSSASRPRCSLRLVLIPSAQIESPLTLLSQDSARSFLVKSSDSDRWTIWLRSTGLTSVLDNLTAMEGSMSQLADTLERQRPAVKEMRQEEQACKEVVREATSIEQARSDVGEIETKLLWREVQDHEKVRGAMCSVARTTLIVLPNDRTSTASTRKS